MLSLFVFYEERYALQSGSWLIQSTELYLHDRPSPPLPGKILIACNTVD